MKKNIKISKSCYLALSKYCYLTEEMKKNILLKAQKIKNKKKLKSKNKDNKLLISELNKNFDSNNLKSNVYNSLDCKRKITNHKTFNKKLFRSFKLNTLKKTLNSNIIKIPDKKIIQLKNYNEFYCEDNINILKKYIIKSNKNLKANIKNHKKSINTKLEFYLKKLYNTENDEKKIKIKFEKEKNDVSKWMVKKNSIRKQKKNEKTLTDFKSKWRLNSNFNNSNNKRKNSNRAIKTSFTTKRKSIRFTNKLKFDDYKINSEKEKTNWMIIIESLIKNNDMFNNEVNIGYYSYYCIKNHFFNNKIKYIKSLIYKINLDLNKFNKK